MGPFFPTLMMLVPSHESSIATSLNLHDFQHWIHDQRIESKACILECNAGGGRGLFAMERIESGEVVARVPLSATLRVNGWDEEDNWAGVLAEMVLTEQELGITSKYEPYLRLGLPNKAPLTPCRWTKVELLQLQNNTFIEEIQRNSIWRQDQQRSFHGVRQSTDDAYLTMLDLVCSRTLKGRDGSRQLVPLIDIANHSPREAGGGEFKVDQHAVYLLAGHGGIDTGQAVTLDYGGRTMEDFLLHYGFVPDRCRSDTLRIDQHSISWMDCSYQGHADLSIRKKCFEMLNSFPTTMEVDLHQLRSASLSEPFRLALQYRLAKKSLLAAAAGCSVYR